MEQCYQDRLHRVQQSLREADLDFVFLTISPDLLYLTGYSSFVSERLTLLIIPPEGRSALVCPDFETGMVAHLADEVDIIGWAESQNPVALVCETLASLGCPSPRRIAVSDHAWAVFLLRFQAALPHTRFVPASCLLAPMRRVKDQREVQILKKAQDMAVEGFRQLLQQPFTGRTEKQVAATLRHLFETLGFERVDVILVGSGPNGANPHLAPTDRVIQHGDPVVIDFGAVHNGYYCDCTRTVHVGPPSDEFRKVFETVRRANHAALAAIRPGVSCESIDRAARQVIEEAGYGRFFTHRLGHGIGLEVHEEPYMVEGNSLLLEPGMTFTNEPGIYLPGKFGCRLEDVVMVTESGGAALTDYTHELIIVD